MKIAVIGYSGSGKSTTADILGQKLNRPVLHLDRVNFLPGWQERDRRESCRTRRSVFREQTCFYAGGRRSDHAFYE